MATITLFELNIIYPFHRFEDPSEARSRANAEGNTRPEDVIPIYRTHTHIDPSGQERKTQARYYVVDGVDALAKFGTDAWDRVVCVLTTGQAWQFKPYKWTEPKTLFHHGALSSFDLCFQLFWVFSISVYCLHSEAVFQQASNRHEIDEG